MTNTHRPHREGATTDHRREAGARRRTGRLLQATAALAPVVLLAGLLPATAAAPSISSTSAPKASRTVEVPKSRFGSSVSRTADEDYRDAKSRITRNYGRPGVMRIYHSGMPSSWSDIRRNLGSDAPFVVSFKAAPSEILSGRYDAYLKRWFASAPTHRRTFWSYYHEPEDNIARGEFSAAAYRAAWSHLADIARTAHNRKLRPTLILMTWSLNPLAHRNWRDYYSDGDIKVLGWDGYNPYESQGTYATPRQMFQRAYRAARSEGLTWGIAEFGSQLSAGDNGAKRAAWLRACASYLRNRDAQFVTYFDALFVGENDFRLRDSHSVAAWRSVVSGRRT